MRAWRWVVSGVLLVAVACGGGASKHAADRDNGAVSASSTVTAQARPPIDVGVEGKALGPLTVSVGAPVAAQANESRAWVEHDLTITNESNSMVFVNDPRLGVLLGDRHALLVGVGGCGYALDGGMKQVKPACTGDYRPLQIDPHKSHVLKLTLWKELRGMPPLEPGQFVLEHDIQYRQGRPFEDPRQRGSTGTILLTYTVR